MYIDPHLLTDPYWVIIFAYIFYGALIGVILTWVTLVVLIWWNQRSAIKRKFPPVDSGDLPGSSDHGLGDHR